MATFVKRRAADGGVVWQARVRKKGYDPVSATFDTRADAQAWAADTESRMARRVFVSSREAEATTLKEALERYERDVTPRKKPTTRRAEASRIRALANPDLTPMAARSLASIRSADIASHMRECELAGLSGNSVRLDLALLSHLFNTARAGWGMESLTNPVSLVKGQRPKLAKGRDRRLVGDEEVRLLEAAKAYGGEIGPIITWAIETTMRRGEIAAMRWEHLDRKARTLLIPETKTNTPRKVPLSAKAMAVLDALPRQIDGRIWGMRPDSITQAFERVCEAAKIEGLTFHDLRHEATSRLFEKGLNPMRVAAITGHKTLQMLKRYTHLRAEDLVGMLG
ncbi:MAG: site-specific integrase [Gammaproteobacteria bacterium]|nr:site-specific integrase [Gammaproteobacteria bacterium]